MSRTAIISGLLVLLLLPLSGCLYSRELANTRRILQKELPGLQLEREMELSLGPFSLWTLGWTSGLMGQNAELEGMHRYLNGLHRVKIGIYRVERQAQDGGQIPLPRLNRLSREGWQTVLRVRENNQTVWVLYRPRDCFVCAYYPRGTMRDLYVLVLDGDELVQLRLRGDFKSLLAHALSQTGAFDVHDLTSGH